ncbi:MAG: hypothetical protein LBD20_04275, partial [Spirochaetaceae bacterium]|nr:hypothetical protein [Spirochaetaceae bacterium]
MMAFFSFITILTLLSSCMARTAPQAETSGASGERGGGIVRFTDDVGAEIELEAPRRRIIALYS